MKRKLFLSLAAVLMAAFAIKAQIPSDEQLRRYAAQMLMVGFKGNTVDAESDAARYIRDLKVGSIVLFDIDLTGTAKLGSRNITSQEQLAKLTADLQAFADYPLLIAADQEGGRVQRLKPAYGYEKLPEAEYLGNLDNRDTTKHYARLMTEQLASSGVNLNLAPVLDVLNPECPPIGKLHRSFGSDADVIVRQAGIQIDEMHRRHILNVVKHFPGHGNALGDSHWGFVDVTDTWTPAELEPFRKLIKKGKVDMVMMRIVDIIYSLPDMLMVVLLSVVLREVINVDAFPALQKIGTNMISMFIVFALLYWTGMARMVRGQILTVKQNEYILAARVSGAKDSRIIRRHILPNIVSVIIIAAALQIPSAIFTESFLSFIGLGVQAPMPSLGSLANEARAGITQYPYKLLFPAGMICLITLAFNLLGDGLRDAFDPKLRR